jgi:hypothetical protein
MHADRPGERPRLLYWYRTAPGITLGRSPLDEDAIRAIEEQHPDIEFDWPAILALSEVMTPEDEAPQRPQQREQREARKERQRPGRDAGGPREREPASARETPRSASAGESGGELRRDDRTDENVSPVKPMAEALPDAVSETPQETQTVLSAPHSGLVDQLAGREIGSRLRGRHAEMAMRVRDADPSVRDSLMKRVESIDPDRWDTPEAVLHGVSNADAIFEQLRAALHSSRE